MTCMPTTWKQPHTDAPPDSKSFRRHVWDCSFKAYGNHASGHCNAHLLVTWNPLGSRLPREPHFHGVARPTFSCRIQEGSPHMLHEGSKAVKAAENLASCGSQREFAPSSVLLPTSCC